MSPPQNAAHNAARKQTRSPSSVAQATRTSRHDRNFLKMHKISRAHRDRQAASRQDSFRHRPYDIQFPSRIGRNRGPAISRVDPAVARRRALAGRGPGECTGEYAGPSHRRTGLQHRGKPHRIGRGGAVSRNRPRQGRADRTCRRHGPIGGPRDGRAGTARDRAAAGRPRGLTHLTPVKQGACGVPRLCACSRAPGHFFHLPEKIGPAPSRTPARPTPGPRPCPLRGKTRDRARGGRRVRARPWAALPRSARCARPGCA